MLPNQFENPTMEETSEQFSMTTDSTAKEEQGANVAATSESYAPTVTAPTEEMFLAANMLVNDLAELRKYLHQLRYNYAEEAADLITVAVTTNSALDLARRAVEEFEQQFAEKPLLEIMHVFYIVACRLKGQPWELQDGAPMNFTMYDDAQVCLTESFQATIAFNACLGSTAADLHTIVFLSRGHDPGRSPHLQTRSFWQYRLEYCQRRKDQRAKVPRRQDYSGRAISGLHLPGANLK